MCFFLHHDRKSFISINEQGVTANNGSMNAQELLIPNPTYQDLECPTTTTEPSASHDTEEGKFENHAKENPYVFECKILTTEETNYPDKEAQNVTEVAFASVADIKQ